MEKEKKYTYKIEDYQKQKPFSSFLSGIAGKMGLPLWAFYVNRGQLIAGFGSRDKNGAIMEFYPANLAYHYVSTIGFRTFIKYNGIVHECFKEINPNQTLEVKRDEVIISEYVKDFGLKITVTYLTLPNEDLSGLVRKVKLESDKVLKDVEVIDGLAQILPYGIDYGGYKAVSNLLQSWMEVETSSYAFFKLRASTADEAEVEMMTEGNFYYATSQVKPLYVYDYKLIFDQDASLVTPYGFIKHSVNQLRDLEQTHVNQVPCAMSAYHFDEIKDVVQIDSLFGYSHDEHQLGHILSKYDNNYFDLKQKQNTILHDEVCDVIETKSAFPIFDEYLKQCYFDNMLRGGKPLIFDTKDGQVGYHIYSRKHGDLERDYNFFSLEPAFYSQGNGNFRDVLQNRRNDLLFDARLKDFNVLMFAAFIQLDGYNPLSIEGLKFKFEGDASIYPKKVQDLIKDLYTPGKLAMALDEEKLDVNELLKEIMAQSIHEYQAVFGEGYWEDHFTYLIDSMISYESIYPDQMKTLLFDKKVQSFKSPVKVNPRKLKYVKTKHGTIRQYGSIHHLEDDHQKWVMVNEEKLNLSVYMKLFILALNKFAHLDPFGIGLSYEGNKPGWNDAANGLPGLFGSGVSEMFELKRIVTFLLKYQPQHDLESIKPLKPLLDACMLSHQDQMIRWNQYMDALENYRETLQEPLEKMMISKEDILDSLTHMNCVLAEAVQRAKSINPIMPTYLTYEATSYEENLTEDQKPLIGEYGLPTVTVHSFEMRPLPSFLEGPARYYKLDDHQGEEALHEEVLKSELYDKTLHMFQTSVSLDDESFEIGRLKAFTKGWLERESNFLHMTYKYLFGLLKSKQYESFYELIQTNFTCFMDPLVYGRSPVENSSFIAPSNNPDPRKRGQGFVSRLSGSTAEVLSMWQYMFFGPHMFEVEDEVLTFKLEPVIDQKFFKDGILETTLLGNIKVIYHYEGQKPTYDKDVKVDHMVMYHIDGRVETFGSKVYDVWAKDVRENHIFKIEVFIKEENNK